MSCAASLNIIVVYRVHPCAFVGQGMLFFVSFALQDTKMGFIITTTVVFVFGRR